MAFVFAITRRRAARVNAFLSINVVKMWRKYPISYNGGSRQYQK